MTETTPNHPPPTVPLAVWPVAQTSAQWQRAGRYHPGSAAHPAKMLPALAARIVAEYSSPGDLVVDPMAGIGTTVVEAATLGRRCVGVELEPRWMVVARQNVRHAVPAERQALATVRRGDARALRALLGTASGTVDLVVVSPPYDCNTSAIDMDAWRAGGQVRVADSRTYSANQANLGRARGRHYAARMVEVYTACAQVLRPGGLLVTVTKNSHRRHQAVDLAGVTVALAARAGFGYCQHVVALHAAVHEGVLCARPSFWQATRLRHAGARGERTHLVVHEDVCVFRLSPEVADAR